MGRGGFLVFVVTAAACGRVDFDAGSDAPTDSDPLANHDEDGDGVVDRDDVCPHISDPGQDDADGDGVGDVCDPQAASTQRIAFFDPLIEPSTALVFQGNVPPVFVGDSIRADTTTGEFRVRLRDVVAGSDTVTIAGHLGATSPTNRRQLSISARETDTKWVYCEKYEYMGIEKWGLTWTPDDSLFYTLDAGTLTETVANHDFRTSLMIDPTAGAACSTTFPVDIPVLQSSVTNVVPVAYAIYVQGVDLRLDYIIVIRTL